MLNESLTEPHPEPQRPAPPSPSPTSSTSSTKGTSTDAHTPAVEEPADDARTPDEYTEAPGSHRRPSDGAALDVGG